MVESDTHIFKSSAFKGAVDKAIEFFYNTPIHPLPPDDAFGGTGVYALYYTGDFELYQPITQQNIKDYKQPIYVGKAVPSGWRTARQHLSGATNKLNSRLCEHAKSVSQVTNLKLQDFHARFMILSGIEYDLVVPVEAELIRRYKPLWNMALDGFGNHDPGNGRYYQKVSEWDCIHPGRGWVKRLKGKCPKQEKIITKISNHLSQLSLP
jgi:hypothetical protein